MKKLTGLFATLAILTATAITLTSCNDDEDFKMEKVSFFPLNPHFSFKGGSERVYVTTAGQWHPSCEQDWIRITRIGDKDFDFKVLGSDLEGKRKGSIKISGSNIDDHYFEVIQNGTEYKPRMELTEKILEFPASGGSKEITVTSNVPWDIKLKVEKTFDPVNNQKITTINIDPWLTVDVDQDNDTIIVKAEENKSSEPRESSFNVYSKGFLTEDVVVRQTPRHSYAPADRKTF